MMSEPFSDSEFSDYNEERIADLKRQVDEARLKIDMLDATLHMAVARLGGIVEGNPTGRHNFLQRIDELRVKEDELEEASRVQNLQ